ncbi:hypothetical protein EDB80DRAFT_875205 [Ilyonectria destructans]|nr:hypothetical protein EDB80DRAFT_875205 [Ilyonectria destructans]
MLIMLQELQALTGHKKQGATFGPLAAGSMNLGFSGKNRGDCFSSHKFHNSYRTRLIGGIDEAYARREQFDILSNIARGKHINTDALLEVLEHSKISGAALI